MGQRVGLQRAANGEKQSQEVPRENDILAGSRHSSRNEELRSTPAGIRTPTVGSEDQSAIHYTTGAWWP